MAIALAPKPSASRKRAPRPRTVLILGLSFLIATGGLLGGLKLEALRSEQQHELQSLQNEKSALDNAQGNRIKDTQEADRLRLRQEAKIEKLQEQLKNQDGFLR